MSDILGYEPIIREGGSDEETRQRLSDPGDPYPYVKKGDYKIYDVDDVVVCQENYNNNDKNLTDLIYESVSMSNELYNLSNLKKYLKLKGLTKEYLRYMKDNHNKEFTSALEAVDDTNQAIRSIFNKLTEYIRKVSQSYGHWIHSTADLQQRTISTIVELENHYRSLYLNKQNYFNHLVLDMNNGGCPKASAVQVLLERTTEVLSILNNEKNKVNVILGKLLQKSKELYKTGDTSGLDELLNNNENDSIDHDLLDDLISIQDKFTGIGINFSEDMAAAFEDILEYNSENLKSLGYNEDTIKSFIKVLPKKEHIEGCKYISEILNRLATYFSSISISDSDKETDDEKYDTYINTIPKILTIVISIYRAAIIAAREYTTIVLTIEQNIVQNLK